MATVLFDVLMLYNGVSITAERETACPSCEHSQCEKEFLSQMKKWFFSQTENPQKHAKIHISSTEEFGFILSKKILLYL